MNNDDLGRWNGSVGYAASTPKDLEQVANDLCEQALDDARSQLHPLMRNVDLERLGKRHDFVQAFKLALEERIAHKLAIWLPYVQAVFKFEESWTQDKSSWDGSIHLLVKVPRLSETIQALGRMLDESLVMYMQQLGWSRFRTCESILEVQQVTANEVWHCISYGAMFCAVYNVPLRVWPYNRS